MGARVFVVGDDPEVVSLSSCLRVAGFAVEFADTVEEALGYLQVCAPDLLLLDLSVSGGGGLPLMSQLNSQGLLVNVRSMMLTAKADGLEMERVRGFGANGYFQRSVGAELLIARITQLLEDPCLRWIEAALSPAQSEGQAGAGRVRRILSVEDVLCNQQLIALFLEGEPYQVDQVQTAVDALLAIECKSYDLILMDLRLPDLDGLDVVRHIRAAESGGTRVPILALSADVLPAAIAAARAAGVDGHVAKPFTSQSLRSAVRRWAPSAGPTLETLNPIVAELARTYGASMVGNLLRSLLVQFEQLDRTPDHAGELEQAAHAIKSAAGSLGFTVVSQACTELESACQAGAYLTYPLERAAQACTQARNDIAGCLIAA